MAFSALSQIEGPPPRPCLPRGAALRFETQAAPGLALALAVRRSKEAVGVAVRIVIASHDFAFRVDRKDRGPGRVGHVNGSVNALAQDEAMSVARCIKICSDDRARVVDPRARRMS